MLSTLITGASGFVGSHLVNRLVLNKFKVIGVTRNIDSYTQRQDIHWITWEEIEDFFNKETVDIVIHTSCFYDRNDEKLEECIKANVDQPLSLVRIIKNNSQLFINTDSFFGKYKAEVDYMLNYINTKERFNYLAKKTLDNSHTKYINLRLEHVYGPNDSMNKFIPFCFYKMMNEKNNFFKCSEGNQFRDFIYIDDVVSSYMTVIRNAKKIKTASEFEVGLGKPIALRYLIENIKKITQSSITILWGAKKSNKNEIECSYANNQPLIDLGWFPIYNINKGLIKLYEEIKKNSNLYTDI